MKQSQLIARTLTLLISFFLFISAGVPGENQTEEDGRDQTVSCIEKNHSSSGSEMVLKPGEAWSASSDTVIRRGGRAFPGRERIMPDSIHLNREPYILKPDGPYDRRFFLNSDSVMPPPPRIFRVERPENRNTIDLTDPGIISYKKKKLRGGREKIVIIRKALPDQK